MKRKSALILLFLLAVIRTGGATGRHWFNTYSVENGLANNSVAAIIQDRSGFIWMGTRGGLCRFDGTSFLTVQVPAVNALAELPGGSLLIGTDEGLYYWDKATGEAEKTTPEGLDLSGSAVTRIRTARDGTVWVLVPLKGLFRFDP